MQYSGYTCHKPQLSSRSGSSWETVLLDLKEGEVWYELEKVYEIILEKHSAYLKQMLWVLQGIMEKCNSYLPWSLH